MTCQSVAEQLAEIAAAKHADPHTLLGVHEQDGAILIRVFRPDAVGVSVRLLAEPADPKPLCRVPEPGLFELQLAGPAPTPGEYQLEVTRDDGSTVVGHDPYAFMPACGELDLHLAGEGKHYELYERLGARVIEHQGVAGTAFAVWAPAAKRVSVLGDFNGWDGRIHVMRKLGPGIWDIFIPGIGDRELYKFEIIGLHDEVLVKADPFARAMELRPKTACRVEVSKHQFGDEQWIRRRQQQVPGRGPLSIYEVHLGSWRDAPGRKPAYGTRPWLTYRELGRELVSYVKDLGFTHIELLPVTEHPLDASWGYQVTGYFAPTCRYGTPDDFRYFVDCCHQQDIGVILDWVPAHFPRDAFALGRFDGSALYEHLDPRRGEHRQWGTYVFNYGRNEVRNFLISNALYWCESFHIDGLRADAVASMLYLDYGASRPDEWIPNRYGGKENLEAIAFLRELNDVVHERFPGVMVIAEESTSWPAVTHPTVAGGLGFDLKWNMGWMHDTLRYFEKDPIHRCFHHNLLTFALFYAYTERWVLPLSHDEVVHLKRSLLAKMSGDRWRKRANLRALLAYMWAHPGKKLLFMGGELGQWDEWSEDRQLSWELLDDPDHAGIRILVRDLNRLYRRHPALHVADDHPLGFRWIDCNDTQQSVLSFLRCRQPLTQADYGDEAPYVACVANFTPQPRYGYRVGVPRLSRHAEILNTDAGVYGGSGTGNLGGVQAQPVPCHGFDCSLELTLPPLGVLWLIPED